MRKTIAAVLFLYVFLPQISAVEAQTTATTILSGGGSLRANYNIRKTEADTTEEWDSSANAFLSLVHSRRSKNGAFSIDYGQTLTYYFRTGEFTLGDNDLRLNINTWRNLSRRLRFNLSDNLIRTIDFWADNLSPTATGIPEPDDPVAEDGEDMTADELVPGDPEFSVKIGRQKFWANDFSTGFDYQYAGSGSVTIGYSNRILKYDESDLDNYQYNRISTSISQGLAPRWNTTLSYSYTDAKFDISQDFITHDAGFNLNYVHSVMDTFFAGLTYYEKKYETLDLPEIPDLPDTTSNRSDYYAVRANLGWTHNFSPHKTFSMTAGPAYLHYENEDPYTTTYFDISYTSQFEHGSWYIQANGGFDDRAFDGLNEGVSEYQRAGTGVNWQMAKDLSANLGASIRTDGFLENPLNSDEKTYNAFGGLSYRFSRWFYVSGSYWYVRTDTDIDINDSDEHRFFITLGASKELYRWIHR